MKYIPKHTKRSNLKKHILLGITYFMIALFFFSALTIDSASNIPTILLLVSLGWLGLFVLVNCGEK